MLVYMKSLYFYFLKNLVFNSLRNGPFVLFFRLFIPIFESEMDILYLYT